MANTASVCARGMADGGYEPIVERMFIRLDLDSFFSI